MQKQITARAKDFFDSQRAHYERVDQTVVRELVQNAADSLYFEYGRRLSRGDPHPERGLEIVLGVTSHGMSITDNGIGFDDLALRSLTIVGESQTRERPRPKAQGPASVPGEPEGRFGFGFYTPFLVASEIDVLTRSRDSERLACWRFAADFTYDDALPVPACVPELMREGGSHIEVKTVGEQGQRFRDPVHLRRLVREVADLVPWPIRVVGSEGNANRRVAPWDRRAIERGVGRPEYVVYLRDSGLLAAEEEPLVVVPLAWDEGLQIGGVLFVPDHVHSRGIRLFVNRYFVNEETAFLPEELPWIGGVVEVGSAGVDLNRSRERVLDNEKRNRLRLLLRNWFLCGSPTWAPPATMQRTFLDGDRVPEKGGLFSVLKGELGPRPNRRIQQRHAPSLMRAALHSPAVMMAVARHLDLPLVLGDKASLANLMANAGPGFDGVVDVLRDARAESNAQRFAAAGRPILDLRDRVVDLFVHGLQPAGLRLREIRADTAVERAEPERWASLVRHMQRVLGDWVSGVAAAPRGSADALAVDLASLQQLPLFKGGDLLTMLRTPATNWKDPVFRDELMKVVRGLKWPLLLNVEHPLSAHLLHLGEHPSAAPLMRALYAFALSQVGIAHDVDDVRRLGQLHADALLALCTSARGGEPHTV